MTDKPRAHRHRADGGYARGDETRRRIIDAAIRLFGERGFEGASTREIAKAAVVNAPALQYYFDSKEGVYRACAEFIAETMAAHFEPALDGAQTVLADAKASRGALLQAFDQLMDNLADYMLLSQDAQQRRLFITHEQVGHGPSVLFDLLEQSVKPRIGEVTAQLVSRITGLKAEDTMTKIRVATLLGQLIVFQMTQRTLASKLGWARMGPQEVAVIKETVRGQCRVLMDSWTQTG